MSDPISQNTRISGGRFYVKREKKFPEAAKKKSFWSLVIKFEGNFATGREKNNNHGALRKKREKACRTNGKMEKGKKSVT